MKQPEFRLHPAFAPLAEKLKDPKYSVRDCANERLDWIKAGCPIFDLRLFDEYGNTEDETFRI